VQDPEPFAFAQRNPWPSVLSVSGPSAARREPHWWGLKSPLVSSARLARRSGHRAGRSAVDGLPQL